ncbi:MAG: peptidylprolyl isomerase [Candidatus Amulumruptor caecigallinarius]|nr:peptidylprolyl isomerase [Candidatus Amulumruptor caecigallinarius]
MKKLMVAGMGACAVALGFAAKDPVIMTVNGTDVPKSEFEYLYNKNSQQQVNPQTLDEYVEMFKLYKLKVADAKAEGLDTVEKFRKEMEQYRHELATPYLTDSAYLNNLVNEAFNRSKEEVEAYHIMLFKTKDNYKNEKLRQKADSLRQLVANGADFGDIAIKYSDDRGSNTKGGRMGYIVSETYPYAFEIAAYNTPEGSISEVVESPMGFHILKGGKHRKARGKAQVAHIMKLTQGKDAEGRAKAKQEIDSLYNLVMANPGKFGEIATDNSEDRMSARQGGMLPWFGAGEMVAAFDSVSFALTDGEISKPVLTEYGYHIIKKISSKQSAPIDELRPRVLSHINNRMDPRYNMVLNNQNEKLARKHKAEIIGSTLSVLTDKANSLGLDSVFAQECMSGALANLPIVSVDGVKNSVGEFVAEYPMPQYPASARAAEILKEKLNQYYNDKLVYAEEDLLLKTVPEYSNLMKEYIDGSLLYEVSVKKVWDKAAKDTEGLDKYFKDHKENYKWTEPHVKGFLVQTLNDSVKSLIEQRAVNLSADSVVDVLRKEFGRKIAIDKVLVSKGTNAMVDNIMFGGPVVTPSMSNYQVYFMINPRIIMEPEEVADVKGLVTSDYQNEFQEAWENQLRKKYPVKVNEKVLKQIK